MDHVDPHANGKICVAHEFFARRNVGERVTSTSCTCTGNFTSPKPSTKTALKMIFTVILFRPLRMLLIEPIVAFIIFYVSFVFGVVFAFFDAYPYFFIAYMVSVLGKWIWLS